MTRSVADYSLAYRMLASAPYGLTAADIDTKDLEAPSRDDAREVRRRIMTLREKAILVEALERGESFEQAVVAYVRSSITGQTVGSIRLFCEALVTHPGTAVAGELGYALVARFFGMPQKAWHHLGRVPDELWRTLLPDAYFRTARELGEGAVVGAAERLLDEPDDVSAACWVAMAEAAFGVGRYDLARRAQVLAASAVERDPTVVDADGPYIAWLGEWLDRVERPAPSTPTSPAGAIAFGVLDYERPDRPRGSASIDDYLQTVAALGQLARHRGVDLAGPPDLVAFTESLRGRVSEDGAIDGHRHPVTLVPVNRDASTLDDLPDPTWLVAVGDYVQQWLGRSEFPLNPKIRPLFISFHCTRPGALTPEAVAYLQRYAPIGCRDWSTVYLLHAAGVRAFFSGCVTTTIDTIGPGHSASSSRGPVALVDRPGSGPRQGVHVSHIRPRLRSAPLVAKLIEALGVLDDYGRKYSRVVTGNLHAYLVARALGTPVKFTADNLSELRFNGLVGIGDAAFNSLRSGINDKLASTLSLVVSGAGEDEVYAHWREICAADVEAARHRIADLVPMPPPSFDVAAACKRIRAEQVEIIAAEPGGSGSAVDVTVALDGNLKGPLSVVVEALRTSCTRPLHLWIMCRDHRSADFERMAKAFPDITFTWLPCDHVDYGQVKGMLSHTTAATLDRLLLPELLEEIDRVVYIDIDMLPLGDIAELADWDLDGMPLAACATPFSPSGYGNLLSIAGRQRARPEMGDFLLRWAASHHPYDFARFNAGALVLDLAQMRTDEFCRNFIPFVDVYGLNDQVVLNVYAGGRRAPLPHEWNYRPSHELIDEPKLIHWAGWVKPWAEPMAPLSHLWRQYESAFDARVAELAPS